MFTKFKLNSKALKSKSTVNKVLPLSLEEYNKIYLIEKAELDYSNLTFSEKRAMFYNSKTWAICKATFKATISKRKCRTCSCCGIKGLKDFNLHIDHIVPLSKDWSRRLDLSNLQILCSTCNVGKGNIDNINYSISSESIKKEKSKQYHKMFMDKMKNRLFTK